MAKHQPEVLRLLGRRRRRHQVLLQLLNRGRGGAAGRRGGGRQGRAVGARKSGRHFLSQVVHLLRAEPGRHAPRKGVGEGLQAQVGVLLCFVWGWGGVVDSAGGGGRRRAQHEHSRGRARGPGTRLPSHRALHAGIDRLKATYLYYTSIRRQDRRESGLHWRVQVFFFDDC